MEQSPTQPSYTTVCIYWLVMGQKEVLHDPNQLCDSSQSENYKSTTNAQSEYQVIIFHCAFSQKFSKI